jgi:8-oxo-dGTP diphosphatase
MSIYYEVKSLQPISVKLSSKPFDFDEEQLRRYEISKQIENFRFIPLVNFNADCMTLPIDKIVAGMIEKRIC